MVYILIRLQRSNGQRDSLELLLSMSSNKEFAATFPILDWTHQGLVPEQVVILSTDRLAKTSLLAGMKTMKETS